MYDEKLFYMVGEILCGCPHKHRLLMLILDYRVHYQKKNTYWTAMKLEPYA